MININNRRYIGSKYKLLGNIEDAVIKYYGPEKCTIADLFAGTGVVAEYFGRQGYDIIVNDILNSNYVAYNAWMGKEEVDVEKIENEIEKLNQVSADTLPHNYFSDIYSSKYFAVNDAKKIGYIRDYIEENKARFNQREHDILVTSLMYEADKIANTVGHFESYLRKVPEEKGVQLRMLELSQYEDVAIYKEDANSLVRKISCDIAYVDPPYNARQYINFYHVLENLVNWDKPTEFEGDSMKFKRNHLKSGYSQSKAPALFRDLINHLNCRLIIVSYNNTYNANSIASNNKIQENELIDILKSKGNVHIEEFNYKYFNSGKTNFDNHKEKLYICEVE
ncbi:MAG: DNA adenine methylase [Clostridia bacterium]|nr:DNA adenine methylase [Clostridia bacterium]